MPCFLRLVCGRNMTAAHYKGGHHPGNDLGLHYTALPPIVASCPYSDQLLVTRKFWSPGANRPSQASELPQRALAKSLGLSQGTVSGYLSRARAAGVSWPLAEDLDGVQLEALLFPPPPAMSADQRPVPDWAWVHRELRRPNVTLALLWEEYRAGAPDGFGYSWFCDLYRGWAGRL